MLFRSEANEDKANEDENEQEDLEENREYGPAIFCRCMVGDSLDNSASAEIPGTIIGYGFFVKRKSSDFGSAAHVGHIHCVPTAKNQRWCIT